MRLAVGLFLLFLFPSQTFAASEPVTEGTYQDLLKKADTAATLGNKRSTDFYIARYLGLSSKDPSGAHGVKDLEGILKKRQLPPKAFVSGEWDKDFIDWFEKGPYSLWGGANNTVREKARSFEIASQSYQNKYFVTVVACPETELWHVVQGGVLGKPLILSVGSASDKPLVFFGKIFKGYPSFQFNPLFLKLKRRSLHYVWKPEFYDLDKDGVPEIWLRYNLTWGNGFSQVLEIYKMENESELVLFKRFQADDEGIVRRLADGRVELGRAYGSKNDLSRFGFDRHHFVVYEFKKDAFVKVHEEDRPFVLKTPEWRSYFLE